MNIDIKGLGAFVFIIYFKKETNRYYLRAHRDKVKNGISILMVKLDIHYILKKKEIFSIGDLYFQLQCYTDRIEVTKLASKISSQNRQDLF